MEGAHRADEPRDGERLSGAGSGAGEACTAQPTGGAAALWSGASYERVAATFAPVHRRVVETLAPRAGERLLDLACGTGGVALVAAEAGADVTGLDISADQLAKARAAAAGTGLSIRFDEGDCERLPYGDASFDLVASAFGVIFAPSHERAAAEVTRVCRPGGRLAVTAWGLDDWARLNGRLRPAYEGVDSRRWSEEAYVRALLPEFDLSFEHGSWAIEAASAEALWELLASSVPPLKAWLDTLDADRRAEVAVEYLAMLAEGRLERDYVLMVGLRR